MQLDSSIDQRLKELEDVNHEIQTLRERSEQEYQMTQQNYYELLAAKMDKSKSIYDLNSLNIKSQIYQDVATGRFQSQFNGDTEAIRQTLDQSRNRN